jgi:hypothetical protein
MVIQTHKIEPHWNYLLAIERDLGEISRFVEFDERNFACFSIEIARVLLASAAEVDVVCKQICKEAVPGCSAENINDYRTHIKAAFPRVPTFNVLIPRFRLTLTPWEEWTKPDGVPLWWRAYNKTKHQRDTEYYQANLTNTLNAVAGLFVMVLHLYKDNARLGRLFPNPQLLRVPHAAFGGIAVQGHEVGTVYLL